MQTAVGEDCWMVSHSWFEVINPSAILNVFNVDKTMGSDPSLQHLSALLPMQTLAGKFSRDSRKTNRYHQRSLNAPHNYSWPLNNYEWLTLKCTRCKGCTPRGWIINCFSTERRLLLYKSLSCSINELNYEINYGLRCDAH